MVGPPNNFYVPPPMLMSFRSDDTHVDGKHGFYTVHMGMSTRHSLIVKGLGRGKYCLKTNPWIFYTTNVM